MAKAVFKKGDAVFVIGRWNSERAFYGFNGRAVISAEGRTVADAVMICIRLEAEALAEDVARARDKAERYVAKYGADRAGYAAARLADAEKLDAAVPEYVGDKYAESGFFI
jgi:hypothetical protein